MDWDNKEEVLEIVRWTNSLRFVSDRLRDDYDVVLESIHGSLSWSLEYASDRLKDNEDIILEALKYSSYVFKYASERLRDDYDFVLKAVRQSNKLVLKHASKRVQVLMLKSYKVSHFFGGL